MTRTALLRGLLVALIWLGPGVADAGFAIVDEAGHQTLVSRGRLKFTPREAGVAIVLDVGRGKMWVADAARRIYWDGTVEEYCGAAQGTVAAAEQQIGEHVKGMPPAQRQQIEDMLRQMAGGRATGTPAPRVIVEPTAETETIARFPTRKYRVLADGQLYEELWLTTDPALLGDLDLGRAPDTFGRMFACLAGAGGGRVEASAEYRQLFRQGWPLRAVHHGEGKAVDRMRVTRVERREVPEADLAPPTAFRPASLAEVFGRAR